MSSNRVAIVNPETLLGNEVQETLEPRSSSELALELYTTGSDEDSLLTEIQGEAGLIQPWHETSLEGVTLAFLCGSLEAVKKASESLPSGCTGIVVAPEAGSEIGRPVVAGVNDQDLESGRVYLSPHPGAVALALLLSGLAPLAVEDGAATVIQPVSLYDERGLESLFEETRDLLNFRDAPAGSPFPAQAAFNIFPAGPDMPSLASLVLEIVGGVRPKVQLLQGGIFHGLAVSLYAQLGANTREEEIASALGAVAGVEVVSDEEWLGPVSTVNRPELLVGPIVAADEAGSFWIWSVLDNLTRGGALNAVDLAARLIPDLVR